MNRILIASSNIESIGHEDNILEVAFIGGNIYRYRGVSKDVYQELMSANSKGKYLSSHVKSKYQYRKK